MLLTSPEPALPLTRSRPASTVTVPASPSAKVLLRIGACCQHSRSLTL